jgi:uncharacterized membrane protein
MISKKLLKNWLIVFVVLVVIDIVWHKVIFGSFLNEQFKGVAYFTGGEFFPLIQFIILGDILVSFGYAYLVSEMSRSSGKYILNGALFGLVVNGSYSIYDYALLPNWPAAVVIVDVLNGIVFGAVIGAVLQYLNKGFAKKEKSK